MDGGKLAQLGLPTAIALTVGSIVGTGIFGIPGAIAPYCWLSIPAFIVVDIGSLAIALSFSQLARRANR